MAKWNGQIFLRGLVFVAFVFAIAGLFASSRQRPVNDESERALSYACGYLFGFDDAAEKALGTFYSGHSNGPACDVERDHARRLGFSGSKKETSRWQPLPQN